MSLSSEAKLVSGITLLAVPTVMYGGITVLGLARISAPLAAVMVSGGFFGVAFFPALRWLLYFGGLSLIAALWLTAVGILRNLHPTEPRA
jgi:hypothetical protein